MSRIVVNEEDGYIELSGPGGRIVLDVSQDYPIVSVTGADGKAVASMFVQAGKPCFGLYGDVTSSEVPRGAVPCDLALTLIDSTHGGHPFAPVVTFVGANGKPDHVNLDEEFSVIV